MSQKTEFSQKVFFYQNSLEIMYKRQAQNLPAGTVIFFGDSQIQGLAVTAVSPQAANFGIGHQQMRHLSKNISGYAGLLHAERLVIGIGINDLLLVPDLKADQTISGLVTSLKCCLHKTAILSVLPVNEKTLQKPGLNRRIIEFNKQIEIAAKHFGFLYIDIFTSFADENTGIAYKYDLGDGLHLNPTGYDLLIQKLKTAIQQGTDNER